MPTGNIVSKLWFVRVTAPHVLLSEHLGCLDFMDMPRHLVVAHVGERTEKEHVHMLIEFLSPLQKQSVDKRFKKLFGVSGADYSSKPWDGDMGAGAGSYLFHDPSAAILKNVGFTEAEIAEFKRLNADIQKVVEVNKQRASGRCVERILKHIEESNRTWTRQEVARQLVEDIKQGVMYEPGDYVLRRYIEEIYAKQLKGKDWEKYASLRVSALVRQEDVEIYHAL